MSSYLITDIAKEVRIAIDQNMSQEELEGFGDVDTLSLTEIIESKIPDAARYILLNAPLKMFDRFTAIPTSVTAQEKNADGNFVDVVTKLGNHSKFRSSDTNYVYTLTIPEDYLRLVSFLMSDWVRPVSESEVIDSTTPLYMIQTSKIEGVRGNPEKPVVALVVGGTKSYLRGFSTKSENTTCSATYIAMPKVADGKIDLPSRLYRSVVYATAYFTELAYGATEKAAEMMAIAKTLAEITDLPRGQQQYAQPQNEVTE